MRKNLIKVIDLFILLISLLIFILTETKTVELFYPWHMAICYAMGGIGLVHVVYSVFNKKLMSLGFGSIMFVIFFVYLLFAVLKMENVLLGIFLILFVIILLSIIKYLFNIRSAFTGDNKVSGYKNYKERRKEQSNQIDNEN